MDTQDILNWGSIALGPLGLFILVVGLLALRSGRGRGTLYIIFGAILLAGSGVMVFHFRWPQIKWMLKSEQIDDEEAKGRLEKDPLKTPEYKPGDWPQWRGLHRDGVAADRGLLTEWPKAGPTVDWKKPIGGGYSSVSVWNGRLYTMDRQGDQERVLCLDAKTGKEIWVHSYDADYAGISYGAGPRATPTVHAGRVYTVGAAGNFLCLEAAPADNKPNVFWEHDLLEEYDGKVPMWGVACSPLIDGDLVIVQPGGKKGSVAAFHRETGKEVWASLNDPSGYSSPVVVDAAGTRQVICFTGERMVGLRTSNGELLWKYDWPTQHKANVATPIVVSNFVFLSSNYSMGCALLELSSDGDGVSAAEVYFRKNKLMRNHHSNCVLYDKHLYGFDIQGYGGQGTLKCINLQTFKEDWDSGRDIKQKGCLICADGHLIVLTQDGKLLLVEATPSEYRKKSEFQLFDSEECWALPALSEGRLYVRSNSGIVCLDLRKR